MSRSNKANLSAAKEGSVVQIMWVNLQKPPHIHVCACSIVNTGPMSQMIVSALLTTKERPANTSSSMYHEFRSRLEH